MKAASRRDLIFQSSNVEYISILLARQFNLFEFESLELNHQLIDIFITEIIEAR